jgi:hypothetical protein
MTIRNAPLCIWRPGSGTGDYGTRIGWDFYSLSKSGGITNPMPTATPRSYQSESRRTRFESDSSNRVAGLHSKDPVSFVGTQPSAPDPITYPGGLYFCARFSLSANPGSGRAFVGLSATSAPILASDVEPTAAANTIGTRE